MESWWREGGRGEGGKMSEPSASSLLFTDLIHQGPLVLQYGKTRRSWVRVSLTTYRKSSSKSPGRGGGRAYLFKPIWGGLFDLEKTMVSVLHKELVYKMEKLKYKKVVGHAAED